MEGYLGQMGLSDTHPDQYNGRLWNKQYIVDQSSMNDGTPIWGDFISCYTDGSLIQGRPGWGYLVLEGGVEQQGRGGLGLQSTVFQTELAAIMRVARLLQPKRSEKIVIFVDSQAALLALDSHEMNSPVVWECMTSPEDIAQHNDVSLWWVKAHVGHEPNEEADTLAKEGASTGKVEAPPVPKAIIRNQIETFFQNKWKIRWKNLNSCRQTKFRISKPGIMDKQIQVLGQATLTNVIQALMGHN